MRTLAGDAAQPSIALIRELRAAGHQAYLAGGCVRDLLLDREPKDYDVATSATPGQTLALFPDADRVGAHFGVILAQGIEVATFRSEHSYADGRRPESVTYETSPAADAARRDFTINGMFLDPDSGRVLDFVGGQADLERRLIRAIGNPAARFAEDHLRMLRAVRFAARLGFTLDPATAESIRAQAPAIHKIAAERIRDELNRILTEGGARYGFELLDSTGLLAEVLPEATALKGVAQPPDHHPEGDVWTHTLLLLESMREPTVTLAWGALLHDIGKPSTFRIAEDRIRFDGHVEAGLAIGGRILERLRFSQADTARILSLIEYHMHWMHLREMRESRLKRFLRMEGFPEHLELHRLDCMASAKRFANYEFAIEKLNSLPVEALKPPKLITGRDLIEAGWTPGPEFARILTAVEDAQLEGQVTSREEALDLAKSLSGRSGA
jgi:poly(A) polymerase